MGLALCILGLGAELGGPARATPPDRASAGAEHATWTAYQWENRFECVGPRDRLRTPRRFEIQGRAVEHTGYRLEMLGAKPPIRIGILSAIKDATPDTLRNLEQFLAWFKTEGVVLVVVNGDTGYEAADLETSLEAVASGGIATLALVGNADPARDFNRITKAVGERHPNLWNGNLIRLVVVGAVSIATLPGYHDPNYVAQGGCQYYQEDLEGLRVILQEAPGTRIVTAHGPPRGKGDRAIDLARQAGNVGDPQLLDLIRAERVQVGLFGHILEAGGRAVGEDGASPVGEGDWASHLYVNAGSASGLPTDLHGGKSSRGMAMIIEVREARTRYSVKRIE
jgi:Icc-related predicted phosphoesterase